ncbi:MAG: hypothetical protein QM817_09755 [Archangium sp.]
MPSRTWVDELLGDETSQRLRALSGSKLNSALMEVLRARAGVRTAAEVLHQFESDRFSAPAQVKPRVQSRIDAELFEGASEFEDVELSPVAPLGACSAIGLTDQRRTLSALRSTEVVSDPTNVLALECASRLRGEPSRAVHLATSHRVLRAQAVPALPGYSAHFRMFALASGGLEAVEHGFTREAISLQLRALLRGLDRLERVGYRFGARRIEVRVDARLVSLRAALESDLRALGVPVTATTLEHPYYSGGVKFLVWVTTPRGEEMPLIDGGSFDWLRTLTSNQRVVFVASGMGSQLVSLRF